MRSRVLLPLLATAWLAPTLAHAAPPAGIAETADNRFRFHVGTDVLSFIHFNPDGGNSDDNTNIVGFGIGRPRLLDRSSDFIGGGVLSLGFGGIVLDGRLDVGARVAFTVDGLDVGDEPLTAVEGRLVPYASYLFRPRGRVRPFAGIHFGFGGSAIGSRVTNGTEEARVTEHIIYPVVGAQGGVHVFLVDRVSLDALVVFDYLAPHGKTSSTEDALDDDDFAKLGDVINLAFVSIGISAWF